MFDWLPTIPEVVSKGVCLVAGHDWAYYTHTGRDIMFGRRYRVCQTCEKSEWVS